MVRYPNDVTVEVTRDAVLGAARMAKQVEVALQCGELHTQHDIQLSLPQYRLLAYLDGGPERARQLAEWLAVSPPTLTALVDGLVAKRLVDRVADEGDRRGVRHQLTTDGEKVLRAAHHDVEHRLAHLLDHLTVDEAKKAVAGLALWNTALERAAAAHHDATTTTTTAGAAR